MRAATNIFFMPGYQAAKHRKSFETREPRGYSAAKVFRHRAKGRQQNGPG
jgi:hypothetical protein